MPSAKAKTQPVAAKRMFALQAIILATAALILGLLPAEKGPIMLVSLHGNAAQQMLDEELRLLGKGRFAGSFVVVGRHPGFLDSLVTRGVLVLPALPILCGSGEQQERQDLG